MLEGCSSLLPFSQLLEILCTSNPLIGSFSSGEELEPFSLSFSLLRDSPVLDAELSASLPSSISSRLVSFSNFVLISLASAFFFSSSLCCLLLASCAFNCLNLQKSTKVRPKLVFQQYHRTLIKPVTAQPFTRTKPFWRRLLFSCFSPFLF